MGGAIPKQEGLGCLRKGAEQASEQCSSMVPASTPACVLATIFLSVGL